MKVMPTREAWSLVVSEKVGSSNRTCKPKKLAGGRKIILVRGGNAKALGRAWKS